MDRGVSPGAQVFLGGGNKLIGLADYCQISALGGHKEHTGSRQVRGWTGL